MFQNIVATLTWKNFHATSNTLGINLLHINIITQTNYKRYNLSLNTFVRSFFLKEFNYIWGKTMSKKSCTVLYVKAIYIMAIDFFRHAIKVEIAFRLKCPENYAMHTERINSAVHSSVILSFCKDLNFIL